MIENNIIIILISIVIVYFAVNMYLISKFTNAFSLLIDKFSKLSEMFTKSYEWAIGREKYIKELEKKNGK